MGQSKDSVKSNIQEEYIYFGEGLFGFEDKKRFLPLCVEEGSDAVLCLQSAEDEELSFVIMNPFMLVEDYTPVLSEADCKTLDVKQEEDLSFYVICSVKETLEDSTVNLKCPLVVNIHNRQARQIILDSDKYKFRHVLKELQKGEKPC